MYTNQPKMHLALGWLYVVIALISAFLITGILGFMLTPDGWVENHQLLAAFFNPTFWPQLALPLLGGLALGALLSLGFVIVYHHHNNVETLVFRILGGCLLVAFLCSALAAWIYFSRVPDTYGTHKVFAILTSKLSQNSWILFAVNIIGAMLIMGIGASALFNRKNAAKSLFVPALLISLLFVVQFERIREFIRGPYLMPGYMYANQIPLSQNNAFQEHGYLMEAAWYAEKGSDNSSAKRAGFTLFSANCGVCHTIGGINDIQERVRGRSLPGINVMVRNTEKIVPFMPKFSGNLHEAQTLAAYLYELGSHRSPVISSIAIGGLAAMLFIGIIFYRNTKPGPLRITSGLILLPIVLVSMLLTRQFLQHQAVAPLQAELESRGQIEKSKLAAYQESVVHQYQLQLEVVYDNGRTIYANSCALCHGADGGGDGPESSALIVPPEKLAAIRADRSYLYTLITQGESGSGMPYFTVFDRNKLNLLLGYLDESFNIAGTASLPDEPGDSAAADRMFLQTCSTCHGVKGQISEFGRNLKPPPPDFSRFSLTPQRAFDVITDGYPGTVMQPFRQLPAALRHELVAKIISLRRQKGDG